jgi:4-alpha-glucanotransferase
VSNETDRLRAWGVDPGYWDVSGHWWDVPETTLRSIMEAMGAGAADLSGSAPPAPPLEAPLYTAAQSGPWPYLPGGRLVLENGGTIEMPADGPRPEELPLGYHRFEPDEPRAGERAEGGPQVVAVCPARCPGPPPGRTWGWSAQLYATRSRDSWGIGDFADLRSLVEWAGSNGAGFVLLNPLNAPAPGPVPEPSPYFPSSRCFLNPLYLRVEEVPGAADLASVGDLAHKAQALNVERLIDRTRLWDYKSQALETLFAEFERAGGDPAFDAYQRHRGRVLDGYTTFCALAEIHGLPWHDWPEPFRRPDTLAVAAFAVSPEGRSRKRYHAWLQWQSELQLALVDRAQGAGIVCDLAVGVDGGGADAWLWQDTFALGMRVGAPPDDFNTSGQDWGLPPWDPWKLRAASYAPYIEMLRAVMRGARGVRVDHVMGLFRLFWVPLGCSPAEGAYVHYVWQDMLGLLRLEAWRSGTYIVGEDLGTVEDYVRDVLASSGVLSYKLFWFEPRPPHEWPAQALGAVTTHDLPTVAGVWTCSDVEAQRRIGVRVNEEASSALRRRVAEWTSSPDDRPVAEVTEAIYARLAEAPCSLLVAVLDDAAGSRERPNMPGTIDQWPNWCLALPATLEDIEQSDLAAAIARRLRGH